MLAPLFVWSHYLASHEVTGVGRSRRHFSVSVSRANQTCVASEFQRPRRVYRVGDRSWPHERGRRSHVKRDPPS